MESFAPSTAAAADPSQALLEQAALLSFTVYSKASLLVYKQALLSFTELYCSECMLCTWWMIALAGTEWHNDNRHNNYAISAYEFMSGRELHAPHAYAQYREGWLEKTGGREDVLCNDDFSTMRAATDKRSSSVERADQVDNGRSLKQRFGPLKSRNNFYENPLVSGYCQFLDNSLKWFLALKNYSLKIFLLSKIIRSKF
jgi:hypothetical protein